jgi:hypothetical protein
MQRQLFNSPEKKWMRRHLWLPAVKQLQTRLLGDIKYLTFAGPSGHDIDFFCRQRKLIKLENVRVWEKSIEYGALLSKKYGAQLRIKQGEAFDLCRSNDERKLFPYDLINLDFTSGAFYIEKPRRIPQKFEILEYVISNQRDFASSCSLFFAVAAAADVDNDSGKLFLHKTALDLATRLGKPRPLFNLTRNLRRKYPEILADIIPCAVIRIGGDWNFDVECTGKATYRPLRSRRTTILSFTFVLTYDFPALSQSSYRTISRMDEIIEKRQQDSLLVPLVDVNKKARSPKS